MTEFNCIRGAALMGSVVACLVTASVDLAWAHAKASRTEGPCGVIETGAKHIECLLQQLDARKNCGSDHHVDIRIAQASRCEWRWDSGARKQEPAMPQSLDQ